MTRRPETGGFDTAAWLSALARHRDVPFMERGREQPAMPDDDPAPDLDAAPPAAPPRELGGGG